MLMTDRLKGARKACGLTQQQVADILSVDRSTYAYYELGVSNPSVEKLSDIAAVFNVDIAWLMGEDVRKNVWSSPVDELAMQMHVKEQKITELSPQEKYIIGLYRIAERNSNDEEFLKKLKEAAGNTRDE